MNQNVKIFEKDAIVLVFYQYFLLLIFFMSPHPHNKWLAYFVIKNILYISSKRDHNFITLTSQLLWKRFRVG